MGDFDPNAEDPDRPVQYQTQTDSAGLAGQLLYPITLIDAYRAGEYAAGSVATLEIADDEIWPPEEEEA